MDEISDFRGIRNTDGERERRSRAKLNPIKVNPRATFLCFQACAEKKKEIERARDRKIMEKDKTEGAEMYC